MALDGFTIAGGSSCEVDLETHRIRRVGHSSACRPRPRQGDDGHWRGFHELLLPVPFPGGEVSIAIVWDPDGAFTLTSPLARFSPRLASLLARASHHPQS